MADILSGIAADVVYFSIGCGGPVVLPKYPKFIQSFLEQGKSVCLLLIDPFLLENESKHSGHRFFEEYGDRYSVIFMEYQLLPSHLPLLQETIELLKCNGTSVYMKYFRGASFGGISYPLESDPVLDDMLDKWPEPKYDGKKLHMDEIVQHILNRSTATPSVSKKAEEGNMAEGAAIVFDQAFINFRKNVSMAANAISAEDKMMVEMDGGMTAIKRKRFWFREYKWI